VSDDEKLAAVAAAATPAVVAALRSCVEHYVAHFYQAPDGSDATPKRDGPVMRLVEALAALHVETFEAGDVVRVRASSTANHGLPMTIDSVLAMIPGRGIGVLCVWFEGAVCRRDVFDPMTLEHCEGT
jgi:uncharacterized protein YodC (DUF2158 family)